MLTLGNRTLRDYQEEAHNATLEHLRLNKTAAAVVNASVGAGKSTLIAALATHLARAIEKTNRDYYVVIITRQPVIVREISDEHWEMGQKNSLYLADSKSRKPQRIICTTEGTAVNSIDGFFKDKYVFACLIDEVHHVGYDELGSQYMKIISHWRSINPNIMMIGYTGTPYRGTSHIVNGDLWQKEICNISTKYLVSRGFLVPYKFGDHDDSLDIDYSGLGNLSKIGGTNDFTDSMLEKYALSKESLAKMGDIVKDVLAQNRTMRLWFCPSVKYCSMLAELLPTRVAVITQKTNPKERDRLIDLAKTGDIDDIINCTALTTGFNRPLIDHVIWLRPCNSMVLFEQGNGRGARILKPEHIKMGYKKEDCLISDYAGCMDRLGHLFDNPMIEDLQTEKAKKRQGETVACPKCQTENSIYAKRCRGEDETEVDGRCAFFFCKPIVCEKCKTENSPNARECRQCRGFLKDPNEKLTGKAYTEVDFYPVEKMTIKPTKCKKGLCFFYKIQGQQKDACEVFFPFGERWQRGAWKKHAEQHAKDISLVKSAKDVFKLQSPELWRTPESATYRINNKGKAICTHKHFSEII